MIVFITTKWNVDQIFLKVSKTFERKLINIILLKTFFHDSKTNCVH